MDSPLTLSTGFNSRCEFEDSPIAGLITERVDGEDLSFVDEVYHDILLRIIHGDLPERSVLTASRLAEELKVSRTPVVAAIDRLTAEGILEKEKNKRAVIRAGAGQWLHQLHQLRELVEPSATFMATKRMPDDVLQQLELLAKSAEPGKDGHVGS